MSKIRQKYNQIKEKSSLKMTESLCFLRNGMKNILDIDGNWVKNSLLFILIGFLSSFSFFAIKSINDSIITEPIANNSLLETRNIALENKIKEATDGYPIEIMTKYIARQDEQVAAYLIAIAKKESNWGKRTPKLNGQECYNLWGFREKRDRMGSGGHTCFNNPKDAVESVSKRIKDLIEKDYNTPQKMVVWKCGYNCDAHTSESVSKWIDDVEFYYNKF